MRLPPMPIVPCVKVPDVHMEGADVVDVDVVRPHADAMGSCFRGLRGCQKAQAGDGESRGK